MATSITPGVSAHGKITNPIVAGVVSTTQNPMTPVEYGRTAAKSKYTTTSSGAPLVPEITTGGLATGTLVGTVSTKGDNTYTAVATNNTSGSGFGATVTYTVASNVASALSIVGAGSGYVVGDTLQVVGDPGVTFTVATLS